MPHNPGHGDSPVPSPTPSHPSKRLHPRKDPARFRPGNASPASKESKRPGAESPAGTGRNPLSPGERVELVVSDLAYRGEGVGRVRGIAVFVPFVIPGERVVAEITMCKPRFARARAVKILDPSPDRVTPPCPAFTSCGGCHYQHIRYQRQVQEKQRQVRDLLSRIARLSPPEDFSAIGCPRPLGYRDRIKVHSLRGRVGFFSVDGKRIIDIRECLIADDKLNAKLRGFRAHSHPEGSYNLRATGRGGGGFTQVNPSMYETLTGEVHRRLARLPDARSSTLFEGYCGNGFLTRTLSRDFSRIVAADRNRTSIARARALHLANVTFLHQEVLAAFRNHGTAADAVLLDPPRTGLAAELIQEICGSQARLLVYVSCDPATFARDAALLAHDWELSSLTVLDMFPQTAHIEVVGTFTRRS